MVDLKEAGCLVGSGGAFLSDTMCLSISFRKSTPPRTRQLNILTINIKQQADDFDGELTFENQLIMHLVRQMPCCCFFFLTLVTGPRSSWSLELIEARAAPFANNLATTQAMWAHQSGELGLFRFSHAEFVPNHHHVNIRSS